MEKDRENRHLDCPIADLAPLVADVGGYEEALAVFRIFEESAEAIVNELEHAIDSGNQEEGIRLSHGLKGSARNFGACRLEHAAKRLEQAAREGSAADSLRELHHLLGNELRVLVQHVRASRTQL